MQAYKNIGRRVLTIFTALFIVATLFAQGLNPQDKLKNDFRRGARCPAKGT